MARRGRISEDLHREISDVLGKYYESTITATTTDDEVRAEAEGLMAGFESLAAQGEPGWDDLPFDETDLSDYLLDERDYRREQAEE
jgi:hypothetical protein